MPDNPDSHTAQNSLDWEGTYWGILPCADCSGIETEISLHHDFTYLRINTYLGKANSFNDTIRGIFNWFGNKIKLENLSLNQYQQWIKVEENQVRVLDSSGNEITGSLSSHYVLKKNGNAAIENRKWIIIEINGKPTEYNLGAYYLIFHSKEKRIEAKANCNNISIPYKIKNQELLETGHGMSTLMGCPDDTERNFLNALSAVTHITIEQNFLIFYKDDLVPLIKCKLEED
jgi:heat shock protein HslJ